MKQSKTKNKLSVMLIAVFVISITSVLSVLAIRHFTLHPISRNFTEESQHYIGRFIIPAVDIDVGLYEFELITQENANEMKMQWMKMMLLSSFGVRQRAAGLLEITIIKASRH